MPTIPALQPDELEVLQAEEIGPDPVVRVSIAEIEAPVRTQDLPRKAGATFNKTVGVTFTRLLTGDHRRAQVRLISVGQNFYLAFNNAMAQDISRAALIPANVAFTVNHDGEIWVASATATTTISAITELWATGE